MPLPGRTRAAATHEPITPLKTAQIRKRAGGAAFLDRRGYSRAQGIGNSDKAKKLKRKIARRIRAPEVGASQCQSWSDAWCDGRRAAPVVRQADTCPASAESE
jgi:hypothetical protein